MINSVVFPDRQCGWRWILAYISNIKMPSCKQHDIYHMYTKEDTLLLNTLSETGDSVIMYIYTERGYTNVQERRQFLKVQQNVCTQA
jgi:hypothetical protein